MSLTAVSLFAGVGGFDLAMERQGINVVAAVEIDKNARGVLAHRFLNTQLFNDVTEVTGEQLRNAGFIPECGIITGGFPCQDLSVAGRRKGLAGGRSGLFWEIVRLADELNPRWLVLENVPGLLSSNDGRDMGTVLGAVGELGYGFAYRVLDAQHFGVAQRRRRVFIVGCLGDDGSAPGEVLALREGVRGHPAPSREAGKDVAGTLTAGFGERGVDADQIANGNYAIANTLGTKRRNGLDNETYVKVIRSGARDENGDLPPEVWAERDLAPTLNVMDNTGESRATVLAFAQNQRGELREMPISSQLTTGGGKPGEGYPAVREGSTVRRLTPIECERLQGFPDNWTQYRLTDKGVIDQADSSRYKQMGNAVCVNVVEWLMERLVSMGSLKGAGE